MTWFPRLVGIGTTAVGAIVVLRPETFARACGMDDPDGNVAQTTSVLCRVIGVRDVISGLAMTFAPSPETLRLAVVARATAGFGDAVVLDLLPGDSETRNVVATLAAGHGALCAVSGLTIRSDAADEEVVKSADDQRTCWWRSGHHETGVADRKSPLRRWVAEIVDEELRDADVDG